MKRLLVWTALAGFLVFSPMGVFKLDASNKASQPLRGEYVPGELLVKYKPSFRAAATKHYGSQWGLSTLRTFETIGLNHVSLPEGMSVDDALEIYRNDPGVEYVEPNYIRRAFLTPDDPDFNELWALHNTGQTGGTEDADIDAPEAWEIQTGSSSVVIAVLDTGADLDHSDIKDSLWKNTGEDWVAGNPGNNGLDDDGNGKVDDYYGWNFVSDDSDPDDDNATDYHGTHVTGIIAAKGNNAVGITGVSWAASIMALKILDDEGNGTVTDEIEAIEYAVAHGGKIINASFGGPNYSQAEFNAIKSAGDAGVLFVAAAGNDGTDNDLFPVYPASHNLDNIIAVAATDHDDDLAGFSNYGKESVDVGAPGNNIYSTKAGNSYQSLSGTSMAAAHVSGLAALLKAQNLSWNYPEIKAAIENTVESPDSLKGNVATGGRINAYNALPPAVPSGVSATTPSTSQIDLGWKDDSPNESGFKIERKTGIGGTYAQVATESPNVTSYSDSGLSEATTYYYRLRAYNSAGNSGYSNEASGTTYPAAPSNLSVTAASSSRINLSWTDNSSGESGHEIERKTGIAGTYTQIATESPDVTSYSDSGLSGSTSYYYRVRAYNSAGNSSFSSEANATTPGTPGGGGGGGGGGCFVATAVHGSLADPPSPLVPDGIPW